MRCVPGMTIPATSAPGSMAARSQSSELVPDAKAARRPPAAGRWRMARAPMTSRNSGSGHEPSGTDGHARICCSSARPGCRGRTAGRRPGGPEQNSSRSRPGCRAMEFFGPAQPTSAPWGFKSVSMGVQVGSQDAREVTGRREATPAMASASPASCSRPDDVRHRRLTAVSKAPS